jgi:hypothetical protein
MNVTGLNISPPNGKLEEEEKWPPELIDVAMVFPSQDEKEPDKSSLDKSLDSNMDKTENKLTTVREGREEKRGMERKKRMYTDRNIYIYFLSISTSQYLLISVAGCWLGTVILQSKF